MRTYLNVFYYGVNKQQQNTYVCQYYPVDTTTIMPKT